MIIRESSSMLNRFSKLFPIVSVTGQRQSGKSTLVQAVFLDLAGRVTL